jgi:hypothetical protein
MSDKRGRFYKLKKHLGTPKGFVLFDLNVKTPNKFTVLEIR